MRKSRGFYEITSCKKIDVNQKKNEKTVKHRKSSVQIVAELLGDKPAIEKMSPQTHETYLVAAKEQFLNLWERRESRQPAKMIDFEFLKTIGTGSFGRVMLVRHKEKNKYLATKVMEKTSIVKMKQVVHTLNEKRILECINNPFVVHLEYYFKDNDNLYLVLPFMSGGDLFTLLRKHRKFSEKVARFYAAQITLGLEYLHYIGLVYRDLKPENIVLDSKGNARITDFGFCKMVNKGRTYTLSGTPEYLAPELILTKGHGLGVDWWSFGILLFEMVAGYTPFYSCNQMKIYENIVDGKVKYPPLFSSDLKNLVGNLLQQDLSRRYGILKGGVNDIKSHYWFHSVNWDAVLYRSISPPIQLKKKAPGDTSNFEKFDEVPIKISSTCKFAKLFEDF